MQQLPPKPVPQTPRAASTAVTVAAAEPRSDVAQYFTLRTLGALFPLTAGSMLYGWRALAVVAWVMAGCALSILVWRRISRRGFSLRISQGLWLAMLLGLMLPPHLAADRLPRILGDVAAPWAIAAGAGILLAIVLWAAGGVGFSYVHPVVLSYLLLAVLFSDVLPAHLALHRWRIFSGDVMDFPAGGAPRAVPDDAWISLGAPTEREALYVDKTAAQRLSEYTRAQRTAARGRVSLEGLLRDAMPPLEDLVVGGHPGPIGASSAIAVLIGGLFLIYRKLVDYRVPLLIVLTALLCFFLLPVPVVVTDSEAILRPLAVPRAHQDWATVITFANYEIMASPLLLMAFFLATVPAICPMHKRARVVYAILLGALSAVGEIYLSCSLAPYLALLFVGALSPWLDRRWRPGPLL